MLGTALSSLLAVAYISLGARWLGPEDYGRVAAAISTANIFFLALNPLEAGLTLRIAGYAGRSEPALLADYLARAMRGTLLLAAGTLLFWLAAGAALRGSAAMQWLGVFCCASLVGNLPRATLRGRELFGALAINWILESALRMGAGLALVRLGLGPAGMVAGYAIGTIAAVPHSARYARSGLPAPQAPEPGRRVAVTDLLLPMRSISAPLLGLHLYTALVVNVDVLAASHFLNAAEAGIYGGAASISRIVLVGANPLLLVLFSRLATLNAAREETRRTQLLGAVLVLGGLAISLLIPAFGAELVLRAFLGAAYAHAGEVLLLQWATACVLIAQAFFAESMLATSTVRGGWLCAAPAAALMACLWFWHDSALTIARTGLLVCGTLGSATFLLLWRWRTRLEA
jgi:O-antigen/teichoic acid export membrane protein